MLFLKSLIPFDARLQIRWYLFSVLLERIFRGIYRTSAAFSPPRVLFALIFTCMLLGVHLHFLDIVLESPELASIEIVCSHRRLIFAFTFRCRLRLYKRDFNLRHAARKRRNTVENEPPESYCRMPWGVALHDMYSPMFDYLRLWRTPVFAAGNRRIPLCKLV